MSTLENNNNTITKDSAISILKSRLAITGEGKFRVKVSQCNDFYRQGQYSNTVAIANFNAMTPYHLTEAKKSIVAGKFNEALNFNLNLSIREGQYKPTKGEIVDIIVEYVALKDKTTGLPTGEQALLVTSMSPLQATKASKVSFDFDDLEEPTSSVVAPEMEVEPTKSTVKA
jgi:hypothetical protein